MGDCSPVDHLEARRRAAVGIRLGLAGRNRQKLAVHSLLTDLARIVAVGRIDRVEDHRILAAAVEEANLLGQLSRPWCRSLDRLHQG